MKNKSKKQIEIEIMKSKIEIQKTALDRYVKVITRSAFLDGCTGGAYFNGLFHQLILNGHEAFDKSNKSEKELWKLKTDWFPLFHKSESELELLKYNLAYKKRLVNWAEHILEQLNNEKKEKIIIDSIEQMDLWSEQFNRNSDLYKALEKKNTKSKSITKKRGSAKK